MRRFEINARGTSTSFQLDNTEAYETHLEKYRSTRLTFYKQYYSVKKKTLEKNN